MARTVDDGRLAILVVLVFQPRLLCHQCPEPVNVDGRTPVLASHQVVVSHAELAEVSGVAIENNEIMCYVHSKFGTCAKNLIEHHFAF